jgi:hypothetical protein
MELRAAIRATAASMLLALLVGCTGTAAVAPVSQQENDVGTEPGIKAVALVFILRDCPICNSYIPELNRLHQAFANRGVMLRLVHADPQTTEAESREHAREYQIEPRVILDPQHAKVKWAGATIAPEAAVFSPAGDLLYRGRIDDQYAGLGKRRAQVTSHDLREALEAILVSERVPNPRTEAVGCPIPELMKGS